MNFVKRLGVFLLIVIILVLIAYYYPYITGNASSLANQNSNKFVRESGIVTKVVDGDTIHVNINGKDEIIRFLGINTPEKGKEYYEEAKNFLINEIGNRQVEILGDITDKDQYGRKLRYVFYENRLINLEILEQGLGTSFMLEDLKYKDKFVRAEGFAKDNGIGLWKKSSDLCANCIKLIELNPKIDFFIIKNECQFNCNLTGWLVKDDANHFFKIESIGSFESRQYSSIEIFKKEVWNDNGDRFFMRDSKGELVIFYEYVV
jgi:micrococcal nuclease